MWLASFCEQRRLTPPALLTFAWLPSAAAGAHGTWIA
jgi:hypothetical protein